MQVTIDPESGFCFGVVQAIQNAEEELKQSKSLLCLGDIVHNGKEINRLSSKGLQTINRQQLKEVQNSTVLIRAHGEPPETYQLANSNNIKIIDSTCPIVLKLQKRIKTSWEEMKTCNGQIAIFGKPKHAEVIGLNGHANNQAIIITSEDDLDQIDSRRAVRFFSQTTMNSTKYSELVELTREACKKVGNSNFKYDKSICTSVSRRSKNLQKFAETYDIVIFVSSKKKLKWKLSIHHL